MRPRLSRFLAALAVGLLAVSAAGADQGRAPKPRLGGTVVVGWSLGEPPCLNWVLPTCRTGVGWTPLINKALEGALEPRPHGWRDVLVSSTTLSKAPFTVTLHIRPRARWSDGRPVTAADFLFSSRMWLAYGGVGDTPFGPVSRFFAVDAKTLRVEYRIRFPQWRESIPWPPLPRHVLAGADFTDVWKDGIDDPKTGTPIGDGPFLVQRWEKGRQLVLVRNPHYWGPHRAYLQRLVFRFVPAADAADALQAGEVDLLGGPADQGATFELAQKPPPGIKVLSTPSGFWEHFELRVGPGGHPALRNALVRRALAYAIDREAMVRALFGRVAPNLRPLDSTVYPSNDRHYKPNWKMYRYRPAVARRLLKQARCRLGSDRVYVCAGQRLSLHLVTNAGNARRAETLQIAQRQLRRIGIDAVPEYAPRDAFFGTILPSGDFDVALFAFNFGDAPGGVGGNTYRCGDSSNFSGYCSRRVTRDVVQLDGLVDPKRQAAVANRVDRLLARDVPTLPLFQAPLFTALRKTLHGVVPSAFNDPTWNAENWWLER